MPIKTNWLAVGRRFPRCSTRFDLWCLFTNWKFVCRHCLLELQYSSAAMRLAFVVFFVLFITGFFIEFSDDGKTFLVLCFLVFVLLSAALPIEKNDRVRSPKWPRE